jgi:hypothetical protein
MSINKFGYSSFIQTTPSDVWDRDTPTWLAPTVAQTFTISSTSVDDDYPAGTGARTIQIYGLTDWDTAETSEVIEMDGAGANAQITASYVIIHRMKVLTTGTTTSASNAGTITATGNTDAVVTAQIAPIKGQTQMAIYGVPSTQSFYMDNFKCSIAQNSPGTVRVAGVILFASVDIANNVTAYAFKHTAAIMATGSTTIIVPFNPPKKFPGPVIIKIAMVAGTNDSFCDASFDGVVVDN